MNTKSKQISIVKELKEDFRARLEKVGEKLEHRDKMQMALNLNTSLSTIERYVSGKLVEIRSLELAETILSTAKEVLKQKATPATS